MNAFSDVFELILQTFRQLKDVHSYLYTLYLTMIESSLELCPRLKVKFLWIVWYLLIQFGIGFWCCSADLLNINKENPCVLT